MQCYKRINICIGLQEECMTDALVGKEPTCHVTQIVYVSSYSTLAIYSCRGSVTGKFCDGM